jgi:hypothetical protein
MGDQRSSARGTFDAVLDTLRREATDRLLHEGTDLQPLAGHPNHAATIQGTAHLRDGSSYVPADELADLYVAERPLAPDPARRYAGDRSVVDELQLTADLTADDLHRIRREFALANHPDRVAVTLRERATRRMTIANALIDEALERARTAKA